MNNNKPKIIFNVLGFQLSWFACVLSAAWGYSFLGPIVVLVFVGINAKISGMQQGESLFLIFGALFGTIIDSLMASTGFMTYAEGYNNIDWIAPLWITALWFGFSATLNHSLAWLKDNTSLAVLAGTIFGPLAYIGCARIGSVTLNYSLPVTALVLAVVWGIAMPVLYQILKKSTKRYEIA